MYIKPQIEVKTMETYVHGFPYPVAILVSNPMPDSSLSGLPRLSLFNSAGIILSDGCAPLDFPWVDSEENTFSLRTGEKRRMLVDLSDRFPREAGAGEHRRMVYYQSDSPPPPVDLLLRTRQPTPAESELLKTLRRTFKTTTSWRDWTLSPIGLEQCESLVGMPSPLHFNALLKNLLFSPGGNTGTAMQNLDPFFAPERCVLETQILSAHQSEAQFQNAVISASIAFPEVQHWLKRLIFRYPRVILP